ncbi:MAG TPA: DUF5060 domain-containing protein [Pedobacter sp.]|nr:DUF5060 domain-containing protein [Pedobacter sp.]
MNKISQLIVVGLLLINNKVHALDKISGYKLLNKAVTQYQKAEWDITVQAEFKNPYLQEEITLDMLLISPSGKKLILPCYYEVGESGASATWKARFMPQELGTYSYRFELKKQGGTAAFSRGGVFSSASGPAKAKGMLHHHDNWTFKFDNGTPFRGIGENLCWESRAEDDSKFFKELHEKEQYNYEYMLPSLVKHGGNYFRTWICSWNLPLDWKSGINSRRYSNSDEYFNPDAIKKMDRLISLSDSLGIYMMLTLGEGTHDARHGRYSVSTPQFFVDAQAKAQYRNRLRFIVARWGYSASVGAWEFFNEIDNVQFRNAANPIPAADIVQWHGEMSTYLKQLDPYRHLITTSISHRDLEGLNSLKNIDFNQKHIYKNNRALPANILKYSNDFRKPYVIGEYGYEYDWSKNFNLFAEEMDSDFKRGMWYGLFSPTPILPLSWWWEFFDDRGTDRYIARISAISDQMLAAGKGSFDIVKAKSTLPEVEVYSVKCGASTFVYVYNPKKESKKPVIELNWSAAVPKSLKVFDCESGKYNDGRAVTGDGKLKITDIELAPNTDKVIIF